MTIDRPQALGAASPKRRESRPRATRAVAALSLAAAACAGALLAAPAHAAVAPPAPVTIPANAVNQVAFSLDGATGYAVLAGSSRVALFDTETDQILPTTIDVGATPATIVTNPVSGLIYVANRNSNSISVIDPASNAVVATIASATRPVDIIFNADGSKAYVANQVSGSVDVIETATNTVTTTIAVGTPNVRDVTLSPDGALLYAVGDDAIFAIDTTTEALDPLIGPIPVSAQIPQLPNLGPGRQMTFSPDGSKAYVTSSTDTQIFDTATKSITKTIPTGEGLGVTFSPDGAFAYVSLTQTSTVAVFDTSTDALFTSIPSLAVGQRPTFATFSPDGTKLYVANSSASNITVYEAARMVAASPAPATVGSAYAGFQPAVTGTGGFDYSATGLPPGLTIDPVTGLVAGAPTAAGTFTATISVAGPVPPGTTSLQYTFIVNDPTPAIVPVTITSPASGSHVAATPTIVGSGEPGATVTVTASSNTGVIELGTAVVSDGGTWTLSPTAALRPGAVTLTATQDVDSSTAAISLVVDAEVEVEPPAGPGNAAPTRLAATGGTVSPWLPGAIGLLAAGLATWLLARRRSI